MSAPETKTKYRLLGLLLALVGSVSLLLLVPGPPEAQAQVAPTPPSIDKECTPNPVQVGQQITCQIDVVPAPQTGAFVRVTDTLPAGLTVTGATSQVIFLAPPGFPPAPVSCTVAGNTVTCPPSPDFTTIVDVTLPGAFVQRSFFRVTIEATAQQCGTFQNTATAEGFVANLFGPLVPFSVQDTEDITVVGCEGAAAPGTAAPGAAGGPVTLETENEAESGEVDLSFEVSNEGDYASQCVPAEQFGQTGNFNYAPGFLQSGGEADDFEAGGIGFAADPENATDCASEVQQSSGASG